MDQNYLQRIKKLVGDITPEQMRNVEPYVGERIGLFVPLAGPCYYALSHDHVHPAYMVLYAFSNTCGLNALKGDQMVLAGKIYMMSPNVIHHELVSDDIPKYMVCFISPQLLDGVFREYGIDISLKTYNDVFEPETPLLGLLLQFIHELSGKGMQHSSLVSAIEMQICHSVVRSMLSTQGLTADHNYSAHVNKAIQFIMSQMHEKIKVEDIAKYAAVSVSSLVRDFKKETGMTPIGFLTDQRINKAVKMLTAKEYSLTDIAAMCGFGSPTYFSSQFARLVGITPKKFQKKLVRG